MRALDPRVTPYRADLAAKFLEGQVRAQRYVDGSVRQIAAPLAPLRKEPRPDAPLLTEVLMGECVTVYEDTAEGWAWGQLEADKYVGWLLASALTATGPAPTHKVTALRTLVFPGPSIKLPPLDALPFGATLTVSRLEDRMAVTVSGGYVPSVHLGAVDAYEADFVAVAERFLGVPYLWGGKTALGLDCSGLVQISLSACGVACPRDSDMQAGAVGVPVATGADYANPRRGDLLFWNGHVAIARDQASLIHANAFHMAVAVEPIAAAIARIRAAGSELVGVRRIGR